MENVFEELLSDGTTDDIGEEGSFDHTYDLTAEDLIVEGEEAGTTEPDAEDDASEVNNETINPTNHAFAQMRTQNKEYSQKIAELDALAKELGMNDLDDFIAKTKSAHVQLEAKKKGIAPELAQEIVEMRELKNSIIADREQAAIEAKEKNFVSNVEAFVQENKLSNATVDKLSQDLENDGLSIDVLMGMPKAALNKILSSYVGTSYQKNLERKNAIRKELPINQSSKIDTVSLNKGIDSLAKQLAGKY